ncbi:hypothetical protein [Hahella ganghwensis]|uniref:hypothetical protein n=1 Tax=Hahella ganghwensis TaxID=286420 RepID=UPI0003A72B80|nr:hypothetical protein [Hahella ganghwensis]
MNHIKTVLITVLLSAVSFSWAEDRVTPEETTSNPERNLHEEKTFDQQETDQAKKLIIGISFSIPPYVITEENSGLELEILRESFAVKGYSILPSYLPLARTFINFEDGSLDGVINVKKAW